jgi:hypothetical protein
MLMLSDLTNDLLLVIRARHQASVAVSGDRHSVGYSALAGIGRCFRLGRQISMLHADGTRLLMQTVGICRIGGAA